LVLDDGTVWEGEAFGAEAEVTGEVVFTTGMVGYPEALTDPSYRGQILCFTYPLLGNYGVPDPQGRDAWGLPAGFESPGIQVRGMIARVTTDPHHWNSRMPLSSWLQSQGIPGIAGLDTRRLTEHLRSVGVRRGILATGESVPSPEVLAARLRTAPRYEEEDHVGEVAPREPVWVRSGRSRAPAVAVVDCGCKSSLLRSLLSRGVDLLRIPPSEPVPERFDGRLLRGLLVGNGPGDPAQLASVIESLRDARSREVPVLGICLGQQLLALSRGARTFKLKFGHRGQNKTVVFPDGRAYIVSENHGYAVDPGTLAGTGLEVWAWNPDDATLEGLRDPRGRVLSLQGHPEGGPGPREAGFVFDEFVRQVRIGRGGS
jgi:carbamoyl-phosphate synthase small subunit